MTSENNEPQKPKKRDASNERLIVQEMVRLAEVSLDVQQLEVVAMERKATLLGSLCIVLIGYLLAPNAHIANCLMKAGAHCDLLVTGVFVAEMISSLFLAVGGAICWIILIPAGYKWKGSIAFTMGDRLLGYDMTDILKHLESRYKEAYKDNAKTISEKKTQKIKWAVFFSLLGVVFAFLSVLLAKALSAPPIVLLTISAMMG